jgi:hypothetical protein
VPREDEHPVSWGWGERSTVAAMRDLYRDAGITPRYTYRFREPAAKLRLTGKLLMSRFAWYQHRAQERLRKRA